MKKTWNDLSDREQEDAVALLHKTNQNWKQLYNAPNQTLDLLEIAINHLDGQRRKFKNRK